MKVRTGFVSNSSTSSFICDICGEVEAGYDLSLSDVDMHQCVNGHAWHDVCAKYKEPDESDIFKCAVGWANNEHNRKWYPDECKVIQGSNSYEEFVQNHEDEFGGSVDDFIGDDVISRHELNSELCPFCRLERVSDNDVNSYARKLVGFETFEDGANRIMQKFASYDEFQKWLFEVKDEN